jgi:hypothetical protein
LPSATDAGKHRHIGPPVMTLRSHLCCKKRRALMAATAAGDQLPIRPIVPGGWNKPKPERLSSVSS